MKKLVKAPPPGLQPYFSPNEEDVRSFCECLNRSFVLVGPKMVKQDCEPFRNELRRLTKAWSDSGPNLQKLFDSEPDLAKAARDVRVQLIPASSRRLQFVFLPEPNRTVLDQIHVKALGRFILFLLDPFNHQLAGPCKGCNHYYIKNTSRQTTYCSSRCGKKHTSRESNRVKAARARRTKVCAAQRGLEKWRKGNMKINWKEHVSKNMHISKKFLTAAVANGELSVPAKAKVPVKASR